MSSGNNNQLYIKYYDHVEINLVDSLTYEPSEFYPTTQFPTDYALYIKYSPNSPNNMNKLILIITIIVPLSLLIFAIIFIIYKFYFRRILNRQFDNEYDILPH